MAEIEILPLSERLSPEEIAELASELEKHGAPRLPGSARGTELTIADDLDDAVLEEMLDRLESLDAACEIYLPVAFEGRMALGDVMIGSAQGLLDALAELKEELAFDEDEEDDDDDRVAGADVELSDLRALWKLLFDGATESLDRGMPLHILG